MKNEDGINIFIAILSLSIILMLAVILNKTFYCSANLSQVVIMLNVTSLRVTQIDFGTVGWCKSLLIAHVFT